MTPDPQPPITPTPALHRTHVAVVGGGPIGIELAVALQRQQADVLLFEAEQIGHAFTQWPPHTRFFSTPEHVALAGIPVHSPDQQSITGDQYLAYLRMLVEMEGLRLHNYERVTGLTRDGDDFRLQTLRRLGPEAGPQSYRARYVVLTTGGMAGPRRLDIPGEDLPHVSHYFPDPHRYFHTRLLVVGGRNSALEAALRSWRAGARVTLSYRRPGIDYAHVKPHLANDLRDRLEKGEIDFLPATVPVGIKPGYVELARAGPDGAPDGQVFRHETDFVLLATGFVADQSLARAAGVRLVGPEATPVYDPATLETNVPGLFVAGTAAAGTQARFTTFISTSHDHVARIVTAITGRAPRRLGTVGPRNSAVTWEEVRTN